MQQAKLKKQYSERKALKTAAAAVRAKLAGLAQGSDLSTDDYLTLCRYKQVPTGKLTRKAQRKEAYQTAMRDANNKSSDDEEEPDTNALEVVAGWTMGNVEDLL
eukprot:COSAG01_NODE_47994_length_385_cov_0.695804_1_plen_103_part_10